VKNGFQNNERNHFDIYGPCDLDLCPSYPEIDMGHLLFMSNQYVKFEDFVVNGFKDNELKPF
jgi:hypothetical protein